MRIATSLVLTAGLVVSLAACSAAPAPESSAAACDAVAPGALSDGIDVSTDLSAAPTVTFDGPITTDTTERTVVVEGSGDPAEPGSTVGVQYALYSAAGDQLDATGWTDETVAPFILDTNQLITGLVTTLQCSTVGSRVVGVIAPGDAFAEVGSSALGVGADEAIVLVADIVSITPPVAAEPTVPALPKADGVDQPPVDGLPTVVLDETGRPTVTIPDTDPPADLQIAVLKKGDGAEVTDGASVVVHYEGLNWATGEIFDESWARGEPSTFATTQVIPGFSQALVGQTVGSQILAVIPPELGYGEGDGPTNGTIVFVVDILGLG